MGRWWQVSCEPAPLSVGRLFFKYYFLLESHVVRDFPSCGYRTLSTWWWDSLLLLLRSSHVATMCANAKKMTWSLLYNFLIVQPTYISTHRFAPAHIAHINARRMNSLQSASRLSSRRIDWIVVMRPYEWVSVCVHIAAADVEQKRGRRREP